MEVSGYYFRNILKKTRRRFALQASEQALYEELIDICNQESWSTSFQVSNGELTTALNCNEKSLIKWRQSLINAGLISYNSGQSKRSFGIYTLTTEETAVKNTANQGTDKGTNRTANQGTNPSDYNKTKVKKTKQSKSHSGAGAPANKKKKEELPFWKKFIETWHSWYLKNLEEEYLYQQQDFAHLKKMYGFFKKRAAKKKVEFTESYLVDAFNFFIDKAWVKDEWIQKNFSIPNLISQFNQIVNQSETNRQTSEKPQSGGGKAGGKSAGANELVGKLGQALAATGNSGG